MALGFGNNWQSITDRLNNLLKIEFGSSLKVYSIYNKNIQDSQYIRVVPTSSVNLANDSIFERRSYNFEIQYYYNTLKKTKNLEDHIYRITSRIETLIENNQILALGDGTTAYDCSIDNVDIETEEEQIIVIASFTCIHNNQLLTPSVTITASQVADGGTSSDSALSLTFTTNLPTTDFNINSITVTNGSLSDFSGSGSVYTATFTPASQGATTIKVEEGKYSSGASGNEASDVFNWTYVPKFIFTVNTGGNSFTLPLVSVAGHTPNFTIDWGDGSPLDITSHDDDDLTKTLDSGNHTITIDGIVKGLKFAGTSASRTYIKTISNWGGLDITEEQTFSGCTNLNVTASNAPTITSTTLNATFLNCTTLTAIGTGWDVSNVTGFNNVFKGCTNFNGSDVVNWDTSSGQLMDYMFAQADSFNQNISGWDTSNVTTFFRMFLGVAIFNQDIGSWNTGNVTTMNEMFYGASAFNNGGSDNIKNWDTSSVTNMESMFRSASSFNQPLPTDGNKWNVSSVTTFKSMFQLASVFNQDISSWNVSAGTDFTYTFYNADAFNQDLSNWTFTTDSDIDAFGMFRAMNVFNSPLNWGSKTARFTRTAGMFWASTNFNQDISGWDTSNVTDMNSMFNNATSFNQDIGSWDVSNVTNMTSMFYDARSFNQNIGSWNVANVTDFTELFRECTAFDNGGSDDINNWNTGNVTSMYRTFKKATSFNRDISGWDTSSVTSMRYMFSEATVFNKAIPTSGSDWDVSNVTIMGHMFDRALAFDQDLSTWDFSGVTNTSQGFNEFMNGKTSTNKMSTVNYNKLLVRLDATNSTDNHSLDGGDATATDGGAGGNGATARTNLETDHSWTIVDGDG